MVWLWETTNWSLDPICDHYVGLFGSTWGTRFNVHHTQHNQKCCTYNHSMYRQDAYRGSSKSTTVHKRNPWTYATHAAKSLNFRCAASFVILFRIRADWEVRSLTLKVAMLYALVTVQSCQTLHMLQINFMRDTPSSLQFVFPDHIE